MSLVSRGRHRQTIGSKHSKNSKKTTRQTTSSLWRIFTKLKNPLSPKLADKHAFYSNVYFLTNLASRSKGVDAHLASSVAIIDFEVLG